MTGETATLRARSAAITGAAFLMATSAVGPGFLTQTTVFTARLGASFGFAILVSVLLDLAAQLNIWRVIAVGERRAQDIANIVLPGLGHVLAGFIAIGGLAFNVGNIAGTGLGANALLDIDPRIGAAASAVVAISIFVVREAGHAMDRFTQVLGVVMIALMAYVMVTSAPPLGEAALRSVWPEQIGILEIVTLVGGTVGGYITFAGGHRLLDAGVKGAGALPQVQRSALTGIGVASFVRIARVLAALGVVARADILGAANPPAAVFEAAAGAIGRRVFGVVMWAAAITSVVGASYTSVSFLRSSIPVIDRNPRIATIVFILLSTAIFLTIGRPVRLLILAGAVNGMILPLALGVMLVAAHRTAVVGDYRHPRLLTLAGILTAVLMGALGAWTLVRELPRLFA
ncbi:MAG TPA: NRAMP family divalent metal transporter [Longimicrobiales bacterium]|nr:NRAMP family divalent metal transporter [Longimicrobiales bacterium]